MASEKLRERFDELERLAKAAGLKPYDVHFLEVPTSIITEVASYGLPTRYSHWAHGKFWTYQNNQSEMGFSKIYELILNNDPSYAFLDNSNTDTANLMICVHCLAHSSFFANNIMFRNADEQNMIQVAKQHADIVDEYRKEYGDDAVDDWLDAVLAIEHHIDVYKKLKRSRYPKHHIAYKERKANEWEDLVPNQEPLVKRVVEGHHIPPSPEKDLLWFLGEYAPLEDWQKHIIEIVRRESYYFFAQYRTKIANEGCASYFHAELMHQYFLGNDNDYGVKDIKYPLTSEEHLDFLTLHEKVVQPGLKMHLKVEQPEYDHNGRPTGRKIKDWHPSIKANPNLFHYATRLNPYYVGFRLLRDIKERWDKYFEVGHYEDEWGKKIPVTVNGAQKVLQVIDEEDDVSLFRKYLTEKLCDELHLFAYGSPDEYKDDYKIQEDIAKRVDKSGDRDLGSHTIDEQLVINKTTQVRAKNVKDVVNAMARSRNNYGVPLIVVRRVDSDGTLRLEHLRDDATNVDIKYGEQTLGYIFKIWGRPVELIRKEEGHTHYMRYDSSGFTIDHATADWPESIENVDALCLAGK